ncbi:MAG: NAD(P)/FAD-dependent oxidoreductase [Gammaproteobacteria bacterium]
MTAEATATAAGTTEATHARTRTAIIGSGIAGLTVAWRLRARHHVTLFEAAPRLGGHTHTHTVRVDGRDIAVDTGFIVYNDRNYPTLMRLFAELGVTGQPTGMSFAVSCQRTGLEYNGGSIPGLLARTRNLLSPDFWRMVRDILRFNREAPGLLRQPPPGPSLGDYLSQAGFSSAFMSHYLLPMGAAIWSVPTADMQDFPAQRLVEFFANHGLLSLSDRPQWYVVAGGSQRYVEAIVRGLPEPPRTHTPVLGVRRDALGAVVRTAAGSEHFDHVVFACHSDEALALLEDPDPAEREILGAIRFQPNDVVLHTDTDLMPRARAAWAAWNYRLPRGGVEATTVTYWMNRLQHIDTSTQLLVTLNQTADIKPERVIARMRYSHPVFDGPAVAAQGRRDEISGVRNTWYCGAWWRYGFHEDGCQSGEALARALLDRTRTPA